MRNLIAEENETLEALADRLRALRLHHNESQQVMGERLGISRQKYARMEKGDPRIPIGCWLIVSNVLSRLNDWQSLFLEEEDLFLRAEIERKTKKRKRASAKK